jgi:alkylation response protein AidB-like acyl-CoA dehydrogenase
LKERQQFGRAIAEFPVSKEKIAKTAARIYAAESLQVRTAYLLEEALGDGQFAREALLGESLGADHLS